MNYLILLFQAPSLISSDLPIGRFQIIALYYYLEKTLFLEIIVILLFQLMVPIFYFVLIIFSLSNRKYILL